ncbi:hypothetical protein NDU88_005521 [Pleurodeles waltl]|uniref:Uncharacterized protein n=1 Tax=Pleurodeles waltl TaxID=8319 RepID=A0AAV7PIB9_PLEWA|nr:hypothetical protein NDU88_005521 [Pleurodeles waltl]
MGVPRVWRQLAATQKQPAHLDLHRAEYSILHLKHTFYVGGNKCGQCYAMGFKALAQEDSSEIRCNDLIAGRVGDFYCDLYSAQSIPMNTIEDYPEKANLST